MYSLMVLLALLSMYFFLRFLQRATLVIAIAYVLSTTLLLYAHVYGVFVLFAQNVYLATLSLLPNRSFRLRHWLSLQAVIVVLYLPWIGVVIKRAIGLQNGGLSAVQPTISTLPQALVTYSGTLLLAIIFLGLSILSVLTLKTELAPVDWKAPLSALGTVSLRLRAENVRSVYFLALWLLIISAVPLLISLITKSIYNYKYTIAASSALYVLVAAGIRNINHRSAKLAVIGLVAVLSMASVHTYYTTPTKAQVRDAFAFVNAHADKNDVVLLSPPNMWTINSYYNTHGFNATLFPDTSGVPKPKQLVLETRGHDRAWLMVDSFGPVYGPEAIALVTLNAIYHHMTYSENYVGCRLYLFEKRAGREARPIIALQRNRSHILRCRVRRLFVTAIPS